MKKAGRTTSPGQRGSPGVSAAPPAGHPYLAVWKTVRRIPRGRVSTYGVVARLAGFPGQPRLVGYALHRLPDGADVPWQRVINAAGRVSPRPGSDRQRALLEREGVRFDADRVPLADYGWPKRLFG